MNIEAMKQALEALEADQMPTAKYGQAVTSLRQAIAEAEKQDPVAWVEKDGDLIWNNKEAAIGRNLYTHPQPKREPPKAGDGYDLFYEAVRLLDNAIFAQSGDVVRHDLAAHKEALDFFNHVFTKLDLTPSQPKRERVLFPTMLRQMWSGGEVQAWLDENVNKENT